MTIDWNGKLEAVNDDGRVLEVQLCQPLFFGGKNPDHEGDWWITDPTGKYQHGLCCRPDGQTDYDDWTIRNTPTPDERAVAPELVSRLVELAKSLAIGMTSTKLVSDARAIVSALGPADPDLNEAREIAKDWLIYDDANTLQASEPAMKAILKAIKRGRQLEKEGK